MLETIAIEYDQIAEAAKKKAAEKIRVEQAQKKII